MTFFRNYLKITLRHLLRHKGHSAINIFGLSIGIAAAILIFLYARNELTYDAFHENAGETYIVYKERSTATGTQILYDTWIPLANELKTDYPEIKEATRTFTRSRWVISEGKKFQDNVTYADPSLFDIFTFPLQQGSAAEMDADRYAIMISPEIAEKYFGEANPIGKTLNLNYRQDYTVRGVLAEIPQNSTIQIDLLAHFDSIIDPEDEEAQQNWGSAFLETYVLLNENSSETALEEKLPGLVHKLWGEDGPNGSKNHQLKLLSLKDNYDAFTNARQYAYILLVIAGAILLIACINFMNLTTARSLDRAREIGVRKVLGAQRSQLIRQFLGESLLMSLLALGIGMLLTRLFLPVFNELYNMQLSLDIGSNLPALGGLLLLGILVGLFSGIYPALALSGFQPVRVLKGSGKQLQTRQHSGNAFFSPAAVRKTLVVAQFAISMILIVGTIIVWQQIEFMKNRDLNFKKENIVAIPTRISDFEDREAAGANLKALKEALGQMTEVRGVASSSGVPGQSPNMNTFAHPEGWQQESPLRMRVAVVDENFFDIYQMTFTEGRNFSTEFTTDVDEAIILNEAAREAIGWEQAVGKKIRSGNRALTVVGVVKDFHFESLQQDIRPVIHYYRPTESGAHRYVSVAVESANMPSMIQLLEEKWAALDPQRSFDYFFVDEQFVSLYQAEERMGKVSGYFAIVAIIIACLGLFAMASFTVAQRTKEIGIRKTLGASVTNIVLLIAKSFFFLIAAAMVIAIPLAFFLMDQWLADYPIRIAIGWQAFAATAFATFFVTALTIGYQTIRAALSNPIDALRYE